MKKSYPNYKQKDGFNLVRTSMKPKDKEELKAYLEYRGINAGQNKVKNYERAMLGIYDVMGKTFSFDLDGLRALLSLLNNSDKLSSYKNDIKKTLKNFLLWKYKDAEIRFNRLKDIKSKGGVNHEKLNPQTMLSDDEILLIMKGIESLKYKTYVAIADETAGRPQEIVRAKWKEINFETEEFNLYSPKTKKSRSNSIRNAMAQIKRYREECFAVTPKSDDYIFPHLRKEGKHISVNSLDEIFRRLEKRLNFHKRIFPYMFRHTSLSRVIHKLSGKSYEAFAGHSLAVGMKHYGHVKSDEMKDEIKKVLYNVKELTPEDKDNLKTLQKNMATIEKLVRQLASMTLKQTSKEEREKLLKNFPEVLT